MSGADRDVVDKAEASGRVLATMVTWRPYTNESTPCNCVVIAGSQDHIYCFADGPDGTLNGIDRCRAHCEQGFVM
jgi:hypothetical protein